MRYYEKAMYIMEDKLGIDHIDTADVYNNIGNVYFRYDQFDEAILYFKKTVKIREDKLGIDHIKTASIYHNIGEAYEN